MACRSVAACHRQLPKSRRRTMIAGSVRSPGIDESRWIIRTEIVQNWVT